MFAGLLFCLFMLRIEICEDSDLDDSVQIVQVIPPKRRRAIRLQKEPEVIVSRYFYMASSFNFYSSRVGRVFLNFLNMFSVICIWFILNRVSVNIQLVCKYCFFFKIHRFSFTYTPTENLTPFLELAC